MINILGDYELDLCQVTIATNNVKSTHIPWSNKSIWKNHFLRVTFQYPYEMPNSNQLREMLLPSNFTKGNENQDLYIIIK